jgi:D-tyrosyl-tRNA(Tyr) deacylase
MRVVVQRVKEAQVCVGCHVTGKIGRGALIFLGIAKDDQEDDVDYLIQKVSQLRMFEDKEGRMNLSAHQVQAEFLVVSQFTLYGDCRNGRRPSFDQAADPQIAEPFYDQFVKKLQRQHAHVATGQFRAMMDVSLTNDGPVTFVIDSLKRKSYT